MQGSRAGFSLNQYLLEALFEYRLFNIVLQTFLSISHFYTTHAIQLSSSAGEEVSANQGYPAKSSPPQQLSQGAAILCIFVYNYDIIMVTKRHDDFTVLSVHDWHLLIICESLPGRTLSVMLCEILLLPRLH